MFLYAPRRNGHSLHIAPNAIENSICDSCRCLRQRMHRSSSPHRHVVGAPRKQATRPLPAADAQFELLIFLCRFEALAAFFSGKSAVRLEFYFPGRVTRTFDFSHCHALFEGDTHLKVRLPRSDMIDLLFQSLPGNASRSKPHTMQALVTSATSETARAAAVLYSV